MVLKNAKEIRDLQRRILGFGFSLRSYVGKLTDILNRRWLLPSHYLISLQFLKNLFMI